MKKNMQRTSEFEHEFVDRIPSELEAGVLYVSMPCRVVVHLCPCGCANRVNTSLFPTRYSLTFDGQTVSLQPSILNRAPECRSHYWIKNNKVLWAPPPSASPVEGRARKPARIRDLFRWLGKREQTSPEW